jgi:glycosyltransferase involved in cell wall biosynthesis
MLMRILHIYKDYHPVFGGIENHMRDLAEAQAARGHHVTVLVTNTTSQTVSELVNGVRVIKTGRQVNVQSAPLSAAFPLALRRETAGADIAHLHAPYPPGEALNLLLGRARKTVISWHSDIVRQKTLLRFYGPVLKQVIRRADAIIRSSEIYSRTSPWLQGHLDKCVTVPYGIQTARFDAGPESEATAAALREQWLAGRGSPAPLVLLCVGRLRHYKGFDDLIRAMPALPGVIAVIVGIGPMEVQLRALAAELGVTDRVIFAGEVSDAGLPACYRAADVFVLPSNSRAEAFGIVILEAMASGLPVISTEVGTATSWVNQHGATGFVVPARNPDALAIAVQTLQRDPALRRHMGTAARQRVLDEFTRDRMVQRIEDVYRTVLA